MEREMETFLHGIASCYYNLNDDEKKKLEIIVSICCDELHYQQFKMYVEKIKSIYESK